MLEIADQDIGLPTIHEYEYFREAGSHQELALEWGALCQDCTDCWDRSGQTLTVNIM